MLVRRTYFVLNIAFTTWLLLFLANVEQTIARGEPDPMARPTRPKVFSHPDELRRYLELVKDYYSLTGKARYGKRDVVLSPIPEQPWDTLRMIFNIRRQFQQLYDRDANQLKQENNRQANARQRAFMNDDDMQ